MFDWDAFLGHLRTYPSHCHRILPPCPRERIEVVEKELGKLPEILREMFTRFNGAELYICGIPIVSFFRVSTIPPLPPLEWAPEWCVDVFTRKWRGAGSNRESDWAFAMTNYGGLMLIDSDGNTKEWDTGQNTWLSIKLPFSEWIQKVVIEGAMIIAENT